MEAIRGAFDRVEESLTQCFTGCSGFRVHGFRDGFGGFGVYGSEARGKRSVQLFWV